MLQIVIDRIAAQVSRKFSGEQSFEVVKRSVDLFECMSGPLLGKQFEHGLTHSGGRTHLHGVGYVVVATPILHSCCGQDFKMRSVWCRPVQSLSFPNKKSTARVRDLPLTQIRHSLI